MKEKKYNSTDFDDHEPLSGHHIRFENKLNGEFRNSTHQRKQYLNIAAMTILLIGLAGMAYFFTKPDQKVNYSSDHKTQENAIPLQQAEFYYKAEFDKQLKAITLNFNDAESKEMIKESEEMISALQKDYKLLENELNKTGDYRVATAMILNYKSRISILEKLIEKLKYVNQLKNTEHEKINA